MRVLAVLSLLCLLGCGRSDLATAPTADLPDLPPGPVGHSGSWPSWRGPHRDAISSETGLLDSWPANGPPLKWKAAHLGAGKASIAIDGRLPLTLGTTETSRRGAGL